MSCSENGQTAKYIRFSHLPPETIFYDRLTSDRIGFKSDGAATVRRRTYNERYGRKKFFIEQRYSALAVECFLVLVAELKTKQLTFVAPLIK